jgi:hypothetical protein
MVEMIIILMTRTSPARSEARRRRLKRGSCEGGMIFLHHYSPEDGSQHERRPNSCVGMMKAERSLSKKASLGTPQM